MISLCIIAKHNAQSFRSLVRSAGPFCRQILVAVDDGAEEGILGYGKAQYFQRSLNGDFAAQRNYILSHAKERWALHLDTDENLDDWLWIRIGQICDLTNEDLILLPRRTVFVDRPDAICSWPDWQPKLHRVSSEISWTRAVHEWPTGIKSQKTLPPEDRFAIQHRKTTADQDKANQLYERILSGGNKQAG